MPANTTATAPATSVNRIPNRDSAAPELKLAKMKPAANVKKQTPIAARPTP